jgi:aspartokinase-like uncharacterized kinase
MPLPSLVVKVGGSLYDMPDLATRLRRWLELCGGPDVVLIPGGGATVDVIRAWDDGHSLGEEKAHWLALRVLTLNAYFLADLLPGARVVQSLAECSTLSEGLAVLDPFAFARWDEETHPNSCLPHCWDATSDSLAGRVAVVLEASRLCLLKSVAIPDGIDFTEPKLGYVDPLFRSVICNSHHPMRVEAVNLRNWRI